MPKVDEGLQIGDLVLVAYHGCWHFGRVTKRFRTTVEVETRMVKKVNVIKMMRMKDGQPVKNEDGSLVIDEKLEKTKPIRLRKSFDEVRKIEQEGEENGAQPATGLGAGAHTEEKMPLEGQEPNQNKGTSGSGGQQVPEDKRKEDKGAPGGADSNEKG
jgi:hypothetical protein